MFEIQKKKLQRRFYKLLKLMKIDETKVKFQIFISTQVSTIYVKGMYFVANRVKMHSVQCV